MSKVAVVYWSGTGNTQMMADAVAEGAKAGGADVSVFNVSDFSADKVDEFDGLAWGCPAMGSEELEDSEFEPVFSACESKLAGKKVVLFGSYDWGDGEWMRLWADRCKDAGITLTAEPYICNLTPDDGAKEDCADLGRALA